MSILTYGVIYLCYFIVLVIIFQLTLIRKYKKQLNKSMDLNIKLTKSNVKLQNEIFLLEVLLENKKNME